MLAVLALAENAVGPTALKPLEVVSSLKGLSVEVSNTDAEGRLCLADAMTYAQTMHGGESLDSIIEMSTLTGACVVALGDEAAGLFTNDATLEAELRAAGEACAETLWPMPILPHHEKEISGEGSHADLKSCGPTRYGGACTAAAFLKQFVEGETPW